MIVTQAENLFDVHCDGCSECQTFSGVYSKSQLASVIQKDGWVYQYKESIKPGDEKKFKHFCRSCVIKNKESKDKEIRKKLVGDLEFIADPDNHVFRSCLLNNPEYWENVINQALGIIKKEL